MPLVRVKAAKPSGTAVKPTMAATRGPKRSVKRPARGTSTRVNSGIDPSSASCAFDQPNSARSGGPNRLMV